MISAVSCKTQRSYLLGLSVDYTYQNYHKNIWFRNFTYESMMIVDPVVRECGLHTDSPGIAGCLKPIFHCDAKPFTLGPGVGLDPQRHNFGWETNMLVSKNAKICVTPNVKHKICVTPNAKPEPEPMEHRLHWGPNAKFSR